MRFDFLGYRSSSGTASGAQTSLQELMARVSRSDEQHSLGSDTAYAEDPAFQHKNECSKSK